MWALASAQDNEAAAEPEPEPESEPEPAWDMDDNHDREFTFCFRFQQNFDSESFVKTYPSKDSRIFHFYRMLTRRGAMNVKKSVAFNFKRGTTAENLIFAKCCDHAEVMATRFDENDDKIRGINMHHMEYCHDEMHLITQDQLYIF